MFLANCLLYINSSYILNNYFLYYIWSVGQTKFLLVHSLFTITFIIPIRHVVVYINSIHKIIEVLLLRKLCISHFYKLNRPKSHGLTALHYTTCAPSRVRVYTLSSQQLPLWGPLTSSRETTTQAFIYFIVKDYNLLSTIKYYYLNHKHLLP